MDARTNASSTLPAPAASSSPGAGVAPAASSRHARSQRFRARNGKPRVDKSASEPTASTAATNNASAPAAAGTLAPSAAALAAAAAADEKDDGDSRPSCFICTEPVEFYAFGACNHRVCHVCSLRMRALYQKNSCPMCKTDLALVLISRDVVPTSESVPLASFQEYKLDGMIHDPALRVVYQDAEIKSRVKELITARCPVETCDYVGGGDGEGEGIEGVKRHVKRVHNLFMCEVCLAHKKVFPHEHSVYTRAALAAHLDPSASSSSSAHAKEQAALGWRGHPECAFCRLRFYGTDELYDHCRKHEQCHLCVRAGIQHVYYRDYDSLETHFRESHFLCDDPECLAKKFTVFVSLLDLRAHQASTHLAGQKLSGWKARQARTVDLDFRFGGDADADGGDSGDSGRGRDLAGDASEGTDADSGKSPEAGGGTTTGGGGTAGKTKGELQKEYWGRMTTVIDDRTFRVWQAAYAEMDKYHATLVNRAGLVEEIQAVRDQNAELKTLLKQYLSAKINEELHVPPLKVLL